MPFNGPVFELYTPGNPVVTGTTISSTWANNTLDDIADGLGDVLVGAQNSGYSALSSVGGTNTITASATPAITAYATGQTFRFVPANVNTGATTININSLGPKNIFRNGAALAGQELISSVPVEVFYDGTQFNIMTNVPFEGSFVAACTGPFASTNITIYYAKVNKLVTMTFQSCRPSGNSVAAPITINMTNMPASLRPVISQICPVSIITDNGIDQASPGELTLDVSGNATMLKDGATTNFTSSTNTTGFYGFSVSYRTA